MMAYRKVTYWFRNIEITYRCDTCAPNTNVLCDDCVRMNELIRELKEHAE